MDLPDTTVETRFRPSRRQTGSNPFHSSRGPLAAILLLFPRRLQFPIPVGLNLLLMPGEHVLRRDVTDGPVQTHIVVMFEALQERIAYLEKKIQTKDEVLAELMAEHVALKKRVGEH